jgi:Anti-sigma-K factor rskA/Putative zinc-finger
MTDEQRPPIHDCGADAAAYALGALDPAAAEAFRAHLETCVVCRDELAAFQQVVSVLPMGAVQHSAPRRLKRNVMRAVYEDARGVSEPARARRRPWLSWSFAPRPAAALGLLLAVIVAGVGGLELASNGSPGTRVIPASVGVAELRLTGDRGELIVNHLPAPRPGHIYEVWLQRMHHTPSPTSALFSVTAAGTGDVDVPGSLSGVSRVLVTQEPAGGSLMPTTAPVIVAPVD